MLLRHLPSGGRLRSIEDRIQSPEIPITHDLPKVLLGRQQSRRHPAFHHGTDPKITEVKGGKTAREVAEQRRINQLGGTKDNPGSQASNQRNPIGKGRQKKAKNEYGPLKD